ncbi:MAG TPA: flagellin B [Sulfuricurvum sp.]|nr:flagellin B [Sulfuricurvum sp.]
MGFRINTNVAAMNSQVNAGMTNRNLDSSLAKLSSGLRINTAADDASGMSIADSLRSQASALGQAINNANDGIGIVQIADKAMDEQLKILDTIKVKATQAAQDGQSTDSRKALQADITRLIESLNTIATTTSYNGQSLLAGSFTNKEFQIGAYSNQTIKASIGNTQSAVIGSSRFETSATITATGSVASTASFQISANGFNIKLADVIMDISAGTGLGALATMINKNSSVVGVTAKATVVSTSTAAIAVTNLSGFKINGVTLGDYSVKANDSDGTLVNAINSKTTETGVRASIDSTGKLELTSLDGRGMVISATAGGIGGIEGTNYGRLTLTNQTGRDISFSAGADSVISAQYATTLNLDSVGNNVLSADALALGAAANAAQETMLSGGIGAGVTSLRGAMATMDIAQSAQKLLDSIRADMGSVQNQMISTVNNISVTQVNVKAAESNIRDVDFAAESANFSKYNILAQAGSYAMSQANAVQQNVLRLLQ